MDDAAIAREVESTIFRDVEVDRGQVDVKVVEGVVRLQGEVPTPDLIDELEARAARVAQARRVENLLRTPAPRPETATSPAHQVDPASTLGSSSGPLAPASAVPPSNSASAGPEAGAAPAETAGGAPEPVAGRPEAQAEPEPPAGAPEGTPEPAAGPPEVQGEAATGRPERQPEPVAGGTKGDEPADHDEPNVAEPEKDPAYQPSDPRLHGLNGG